MSAGIRFPEHDGNNRNSGISPGKEQLGAVPQNTSPVLFGTDHITGTIPEGNYRDIKQVAETDESGGFIGSIDIDNAGGLHGLVGKNTDSSAVKMGKTGDNTGGVEPHCLEENAVIDNGFNHFLHVVRRSSFVRDNRIEFRAFPFRVVFGRQERRFFRVIGG